MTNYLETKTLPELFDAVYEKPEPVIDGLLYPGTYLFVGAPVTVCQGLFSIPQKKASGQHMTKSPLKTI